MATNYSQLRGMLAIAKGSFKAILRNPSAVAFSFGFPLVFILVFGFIGGGGPTVSVALANRQDTATWVIRALLKNPLIRLSDDVGKDSIRRDLERGRIAAVISLDSVRSPAGFMQYTVHTQTSSASGDKYPILKLALAQVFESAIERTMSGPYAQYRPIIVDELPLIPGRAYSMIDFILPGMLGFSLLSAAVFGVAFLFFSLRSQLVLKRYYATPIGKRYIVLGQGLARVVFQLITPVVNIGIGKIGFHYTLEHGWLTLYRVAGAEPAWAHRFYGFWFYHQQRGKKRKHDPSLRQCIHTSAVSAGGYFFRPKYSPNGCSAYVRSFR